MTIDALGRRKGTSDVSTSSPAPLLDAVLDEMGLDIVSGKIGPGETFTLGDMCDRFTISRTVAREVMRALEQIHLVESSRRIGITVQPKPRWAVYNQKVIDWRLRTPGEASAQLASLTQLRVAVEPVAARSMAENANEIERADLVDLAKTLRDLGAEGGGSSEAFLDADMSFHQTILTASGNEMFAALVPSVITVLRGRTKLGLQPDHPKELALQFHEELAAAIARGDEEAAEEYSHRLLAEVRTALDEPTEPLY